MASQRIVDEIQDTLRFHASSDPDHAPRRVLLTGLGGLSHGFAELCSSSIGLPVKQFVTSVPSRRRQGEADSDVDLSVALGLCLGATA